MRRCQNIDQIVLESDSTLKQIASSFTLTPQIGRMALTVVDEDNKTRLRRQSAAVPPAGHQDRLTAAFPLSVLDSNETPQYVKPNNAFGT